MNDLIETVAHEECDRNGGAFTGSHGCRVDSHFAATRLAVDDVQHADRRVRGIRQRIFVSEFFPRPTHHTAEVVMSRVFFDQDIPLRDRRRVLFTE